MSEILWKPFETPKHHKSREPFITINYENGRITLNAAACRLIPDCYSYNYAELFFGRYGKKLEKIQICLTNKMTPNSIPVHQLKHNGVYVNGLNLYAKAVVNIIHDCRKDSNNRFPATFQKNMVGSGIVFDV